MPTTKPLIPYIRQSRKKEVTISLDSQREAIRRWAEAAGVKLAVEVVEQGVSGSKSWHERDLGAAIEAVQRGEANGIVVAFQDRLSRESGLATGEVWEALEKAGARLVAAAEGLDTATGDHELLFSIKAAIAREQWKRYRANWAKANEHCVAAGKYQNRTPVGYDRLEDGRLRKNPDADAVATVFQSLASGASWSEAAAVLERAGVRTAGGATGWAVGSVRSLTSNAVYKGVLRNGHERHFPEYAVVAPSVWEAAQRHPAREAPTYPSREIARYDVRAGISYQPNPAYVEARAARRAELAGAERRRADANSGHLLSGLVRCGGCGHKLSTNGLARSNGKTYSYYCCRDRRCDARGRARYEELEELVVDAAFSYFEQVTEAQGGAAVGRDSDVEKAAELEQAVADVTRRRDRALLSAGVSDETLATLEAEVEAAKVALVEETGASRVRLTPTELREAFAAATADERRRLVREMLLGVEIRRGKEPLPERVELIYRTIVF